MDSLVAAAFLETARRLPSAPAILQRLRERYKLDLAGGCPGWEWVCSCMWAGNVQCRSQPSRTICAHIMGLLAPEQRCVTRRIQQAFPIPPSPHLHPDYHGEEYVHALGDRMFNEEAERAGQRILKDFRGLTLGRICLELPDQFAAAREV